MRRANNIILKKAIKERVSPRNIFKGAARYYAEGKAQDVFFDVIDGKSVGQSLHERFALERGVIEVAPEKFDRLVGEARRQAELAASALNGAAKVVMVELEKLNKTALEEFTTKELLTSAKSGLAGKF